MPLQQLGAIRTCMTERGPTQSLILDLLQWVAHRERTYKENDECMADILPETASSGRRHQSRFGGDVSPDGQYCVDAAIPERCFNEMFGRLASRSLATRNCGSELVPVPQSVCDTPLLSGFVGLDDFSPGETLTGAGRATSGGRDLTRLLSEGRNSTDRLDQGVGRRYLCLVALFSPRVHL